MIAKLGPDRPLIWLASYPKSGNTWVRALLQTLQSGGAPLDLNNLGSRWARFTHQDLDDCVLLDTSLLTLDELVPYQRLLYRDRAVTRSTVSFCKTHQAWTEDMDGRPVLAPDASAGAILIVRNPLDIVASYAYHLNQTQDQTIDLINDEDGSLGYNLGRGSRALPERTRSWRGFNSSWLEQTYLPLLCIRYEDLIADAAGQLKRIAKFAGLEANNEALNAAVAACSFEQMKAREIETGFIEAPSSARRFFRRGEIGSGLQHLTPARVSAVIKPNHDLMQALGYLQAGALPPHLGSN